MRAPSTLKEYIENYKAQTPKMTDYFLLEWLVDDNGTDYYKVLEENILSKHTDFLAENKTLVAFSDDEYRKYRCNAHTLANDIYGTTELWFLIIHANELFSESEFNMHQCYIYNATVLSKISEILAVENTLIEDNHSDVSIVEAYLKKAFDTQK